MTDDLKPGYHRLHHRLEIPARKLLMASLHFMAFFETSRAGKAFVENFIALGADKGMPILEHAFHDWLSTWLLDTQKAMGLPVSEEFFGVKTWTAESGSARPLDTVEHVSEASLGEIQYAHDMYECLMSFVEDEDTKANNDALALRIAFVLRKIKEVNDKET